MAKIIGLPKLSPTMEEGTLVSWEKKEGDKVEIDDLLAEVETDKATMEFRSFDSGVLLKILVEEGETLAPDAPVAIIGEEGEDVSELVEQAKKGGAPKKAGGDGEKKKQADDEGDEGKDEKQEKKAKAEAEEPGGDEKAGEDRQKREAPKEKREAASKPSGDGRILASPLVRRLARERDIDLSRVEGSGPKGRIIKRDVEDLPEGGAQARPAARGADRETRVEKVSQMRKTIARRLTQSKQEVPHYYLTIDVDAEPMMQFRAQMKEEVETVSVNDLLIKACAVALRRYPAVNASFQGNELHYHGRVDISVAVAIEDGLITPVVRDADLKGVAEISGEVRELAKRAKEKRLQPEEFTGGTFSISNLGMYGIEHFTAVINPPEGAILAVGTIREEPVVRDGEIVPGKRMRMTMSCDHRVIDGAIGAEFLAILKRLLENPATLLL